MTNQAPIEFQPDVSRGRGGKMILKAPVKGAEIETLYLDWLTEARKTYPDLEGEFFYNGKDNTLYIGFWEVEVAADEVADALDCEFTGPSADAEEAPQAAAPAPAPVAAAPAPAATPLNPVNIQAILNPETHLDVARVHDKASMVESTQFAQAATIATQANMTLVEKPAGIVQFTPNTGVVMMQAQPAINREARQAPRVFVKNQPERQPRQNRSPNFSDHTEATNMGKKQRHQADDQPQAGTKNSRRDFQSGKRESRYESPAYSDRTTSRFDSANRAPVSPEMISRLLTDGVGCAVTANVDTSSFVQNFRDKQRMAKRLNDEDFVDGKTCVNVSPNAETDLGKALRLGENRPFTYPALGDFASLAGLYLTLTEVPGAGFSTAHTSRAYKELSRLHDYRTEVEACSKRLNRDEILAGARAHYPLREIFAIMGDALWMTVNRDPELVMAMLSNSLDYEAYLWVPKRDNERREGEPAEYLRHEIYGYWYLPLLREVTRCLRARLRLLEQGRDADKLPLPNFTQAIDIAIGRLRRRMMREVERRWDEQKQHARKYEQNQAKRAQKASNRPIPNDLPNGPVNEELFGKQPQTGLDAPGDFQGQPAADNAFDGQVSNTVVDLNTVDLSHATVHAIAAPAVQSVDTVVDAGIGISSEPVGSVQIDPSILAHVEPTLSISAPVVATELVAKSDQPVASGTVTTFETRSNTVGLVPFTGEVSSVVLTDTNATT